MRLNIRLVELAKALEDIDLHHHKIVKAVVNDNELSLYSYTQNVCKIPASYSIKKKVPKEFAQEGVRWDLIKNVVMAMDRHYHCSLRFYDNNVTISFSFSFSYDDSNGSMLYNEEEKIKMLLKRTQIPN